MMYKVTIFERYTQRRKRRGDTRKVVMMYKVTIFERYTQPVEFKNAPAVSCYDVQSYNF